MPCAEQVTSSKSFLHEVWCSRWVCAEHVQSDASKDSKVVPFKDIGDTAHFPRIRAHDGKRYIADGVEQQIDDFISAPWLGTFDRTASNGRIQCTIGIRFRGPDSLLEEIAQEPE